MTRHFIPLSWSPATRPIRTTPQVMDGLYRQGNESGLTNRGSEGFCATMSYEEAGALSPLTGFRYAALSKMPAMKIACARISRPSMFRT